MANLSDSVMSWRDWVLSPSASGHSLFPTRNVFRSPDLDETRHAIAQVYCEHELNVVGRAQRLDAALAAWDFGKVSIGYKRHGANVVIRPGRLGWYYGINLLVKGSDVTSCDRSEVESRAGSAIVLSPTQEIEMRWGADCEHLSLRIDRETLERELSRMLGQEVDTPVVFDPAMGLSRRESSGWAATVAFALDEIRQGSESLRHPLVRSRVEQLIIDQLLLAQQHTFSEQLRTGHSPARTPTVRKAIEIIRARAAEPLTVPLLAEMVGVSARSLQLGFRDYLGTTPLEHLRMVRLARARNDLLAADPKGKSVTEIAYRWGFGHLARFAGYYKHRYGELPSETLRRR